MKRVTVTLDLADILRERIDECARFRRDARVSKEVLVAFLEEKRLSEEEAKEVQDYIFGRLLELFLDSKAGLIIPDDALHKLAEEFFKDQKDIGIAFAYQDFYAYQFVDKLNDIVRRAFRVRALFAKSRPPDSVRRLCREAYQSYLYGNHTASVALIRSVVEAALKDRLGSDIGGLSKLNEVAWKNGVYPKKIWHRVKQINDAANSFIHDGISGKTPSESKNLELIGLAQEALQVLIA